MLYIGTIAETRRKNVVDVYFQCQRVFVDIGSSDFVYTDLWRKKKYFVETRIKKGNSTRCYANVTGRMRSSLKVGSNDSTNASKPATNTLFNVSRRTLVRECILEITITRRKGERKFKQAILVFHLWKDDVKFAQIFLCNYFMLFYAVN